MAGPSSVPKIRTDLAYYGVVTRVISATQFVAAGLAGLGDGALVGYAAYVLSKANGTLTAPHTEQPAVTVYVSASGTFTHVAYTANLAVGDQLILLHPNISTIPAGWLATILAAIGLTGFNQGLCYYGVVTGVPVAGQFEIAALAGLGAAKFATVIPEYMYHAFVLRDAAGGGVAPQGESQPVSNYATNTGNFTAAAFTVPVGIGDEILIIHPFLARTMNLAGLPPAVGSLAANWQSGVATSGEAGADLVSIGAANTSYKLNSLLVDINLLTLAATITVKLFMEVVGVERKVYQQVFEQGSDPDGLWIVNGPVGIHDILRVEVQSNNALDNGLAIGYDYMLEVM